MGLFGWGDKKEKEKKEKADREHAETRRRMEEAKARRQRETAAAGASPASTTAAAPGATAPSTAPAAGGGEYTVQSGDSLSKIAQQKLGDANKWRQIYDANRATIGDDPDLIKPGQRLRIPG